MKWESWLLAVPIWFGSSAILALLFGLAAHSWAAAGFGGTLPTILYLIYWLFAQGSSLGFDLLQILGAAVAAVFQS